VPIDASGIEWAAAAIGGGVTALLGSAIALRKTVTKWHQEGVTTAKAQGEIEIIELLREELQRREEQMKAREERERHLLDELHRVHDELNNLRQELAAVHAELHLLRKRS
jgi:predicted RNase H-like nuclease (RuvC/YqgF family)